MPWYRCDVLLVLCVCPLACVPASPCPSGCCCRRPGFLVLCESLGLRSLPRAVPLSTSALSVARNQLCNVDHLLRRFSGLQELSLSHNLLARFPRGLPASLESLQLRENRITYLTSGTLRHLTNLTRLDLEDNHIRAIQPGALQGLRKLQVLTLKGNRLASLPRKLPPSLTHLDLSANCISALELPSLSALVNLQVLKINSNCLRSVPESAFDGLRHLRSLDLNNNRWVCECDILYLYRWLLNGHLRMATDLVCIEPLHLAHHLLLNLSITTICPGVHRTNQGKHPESFTAKPGNRSSLDSKDFQDFSAGFMSKVPTDRFLSKARKGRENVPTHQASHEHYSLETLSFDECVTLNKIQTLSPRRSTTLNAREEETCQENTTGSYSRVNTTVPVETRFLFSTKLDAWPTRSPLPVPQPDAVIVSLLAVLCVLVLLLMLAVLLVLQKTLHRQRRVAPLDRGAGV